MMSNGISVTTSKDIFLLSVHHTGTVFLFDAFKTNPDLHCVELEFALMQGKVLAPKKRNVVQCHVNVDYRSRFWDWWAPWLIDKMVRKFPTVMPVRDPLLSIITRHRREPERGPHTFIVDAWVRVVDTLIFPRPFFVSVDLEPRPGILERMAYHCGLSPWPGLDEVGRFWRPRNRTPGKSELVEAYESRDTAYLEKELPVEMAQLRNAEPALRPFFEDRGYENLLWW